MAAMGISWNGTSRIYIIQSEVKLNAQAFIKLALAPVVRYDFPRLYGDRGKDVIFHMDNAPAHTVNATVQWMKDHHVNWIPSVHWMANSSDLAPMDYAICSNFKRILKMSRAHTAPQMARVTRGEGKKIISRTCRNALSGRSFRVHVRLDASGAHVEHIKKI